MVPPTRVPTTSCCVVPPSSSLPAMSRQEQTSSWRKAASKQLVKISLCRKDVRRSTVQTNGSIRLSLTLYSNYGVTSWQPIKSEQGRGQKLLSEKPGAYYWNESIHPETDAFEYFVSDEKEANNLRGQGFGVTLSQIKDGISRGSAVLVSTGEKTPSSNLIINERVAQGLSFSKGSTNQSYPSSQMGSIALLRQLYYDGLAQDKATDEKNLSIEAWRTNANLKSIIAVNSWQEVLRAVKVAKEFNKTYIVKSAGDEYQRIDAIKATNTPLIIPINFPEVVKSDDILDLDKISLEQIKHVALAPRNPGILHRMASNSPLHQMDSRRSKNSGKSYYSQ
jgi:hypothetical protein